MRLIAPIILALTLLSCGATPKQVHAVHEHLVFKCRLLAMCLPPIELHGMSPDEFCDWMDSLGLLAEFIAEEGQTCQLK